MVPVGRFNRQLTTLLDSRLQTYETLGLHAKRAQAGHITSRVEQGYPLVASLGSLANLYKHSLSFTSDCHLHERETTKVEPKVPRGDSSSRGN